MPADAAHGMGGAGGGGAVAAEEVPRYLRGRSVMAVPVVREEVAFRAVACIVAQLATRLSDRVFFAAAPRLKPP